MKLMKKSIAFLLLVTVSFLTVNCSTSGDGGSSSSTFYLKCKINGVQFKSTDPSVLNSLSKSIVGISDNNDTVQETLVLFMPLAVAPGTYTITEEPSNENSYGVSYNNYDTEVASLNAAGTMTVTQVTADVIKGTFSFTSPDGDGNIITVTDGSFRAENIE